ncbi:MAG: phage major capsid protein [Pseudonocardia sp.]|nr:phage major capsid protein [Pseudonocardia sp.]
MTTLKDKQTELGRIWEQMKVHNDTGDGEAYDKAELDYDKVQTEIERMERHEARAASNSRVDRTGVVPGGDGSSGGEKDDDALYARVFNAYLRGGQESLQADDRRLLMAQFRAESGPQMAAGVGTGAGGGFLVPPAFRDQVIEQMKFYGPMLLEAEELVTETGANIPWPTNDDTANVGAILGENTAINEQDVTLGSASLDSYVYTSKLVRVSYQLLQDRPDFDTWLARKLGERIGRILNAHFTTGTGTAQPDGIVTSSVVGATGTGSFATTGGISFDTLIDLEESLDPAYGAIGGLKYMLHQTARKQVRKLKDLQGRYLWEPSQQAGVPATINGYPVVINNDMPTLAVSSKSVGFGSIREAYVIRIVRELTTVRLAERYADFLQVGFFAFKRADGTMQNTSAFKIAQTSATA